MDNSTIAIIVTGILSILSVFGLLIYVFKSSNVLKQVGEVLMAVSSALEDGKITADELAAVKKEIADIKPAIAELFKKKEA